MGQIFVGGSDVVDDGNIDDILANEVVVGPGASLRVIGNLEPATLIIEEAGSLVVEGNISTVEAAGHETSRLVGQPALLPLPPWV